MKEVYIGNTWHKNARGYTEQYLTFWRKKVRYKYLIETESVYWRYYTSKFGFRTEAEAILALDKRLNGLRIEICGDDSKKKYI